MRFGGCCWGRFVWKMRFARSYPLALKNEIIRKILLYFIAQYFMSLLLNKPELLAPAGSEEALRAAVENGANAMYFGIAGTGNFNARVRAKNIPLEKLGETVTFLHRRNVLAYLTLNTLVFAEELPDAEILLREFAATEFDAVLVQDLGIAKLAR